MPLCGYEWYPITILTDIWPARSQRAGGEHKLPYEAPLMITSTGPCLHSASAGQQQGWWLQLLEGVLPCEVAAKPWGCHRMYRPFIFHWARFRLGSVQKETKPIPPKGPKHLLKSFPFCISCHSGTHSPIVSVSEAFSRSLPSFVSKTLAFCKEMLGELLTPSAHSYFCPLWEHSTRTARFCQAP